MPTNPPLPPESAPEPESLGTIDHLDVANDTPPVSDSPTQNLFSLATRFIFTTNTWKHLGIRTVLLFQVFTIFIATYSIIRNPSLVKDFFSIVFQEFFTPTLDISNHSEAIELLKNFKTQKDVVALGINTYTNDGLDVNIWVEPGDYFRGKPLDSYMYDEESIRRRIFHESGECYSSFQEEQSEIYVSCPLETPNGRLQGFLWIIFNTAPENPQDKYISTTKILTRYIRKIVF